MRVGLVRNVGLSAVALLALGLAGCDDNPLEFEDGAAVLLTTNPSTINLPAGRTTLLETRTVDAGNRPTWEDVTASIDATCGAGTLTVVVAADNEPEVVPPGRFDVTGGTTVGQTCINLSGGGVSATVVVSVVATSVGLAGPDELVFETTAQLVATLLGFNGETLSPFDQTTDLVWSTTDAAILAVDGTGFITAQGVGSATITATWTGPVSGVVAVGTIDITVPPLPIPVISAVSPVMGDLGQVITVTGVDFFSVTNVFIDGAESPFTATVVSPTELTFLMPANLALGAHDIGLGTTGGFDISNLISYTSLAGFVNGGSEPANDDPSTAAFVTLPFVTNDVVDAVDVDDFFLVSLASDATLEIFLDWDDAAVDPDILVVDAAFTVFECTDGATGAKPENSTCALTAGDHAIWINWFAGPGPAVYSLIVQ